MGGVLEQHSISYLSTKLFLNRKFVCNTFTITKSNNSAERYNPRSPYTYFQQYFIHCKNAYNVASFNISLLKDKRKFLPLSIMLRFYIQ
jgi:hypothetical protein